MEHVVIPILAAVFMGLFVYLVAAQLTGRTPLRRSRLRAPTPARLQHWLQQAGLDLTPLQFVLGSLLVGALTFVLLWQLTGVAGVAFVPAVSLSLLPRAFFARRRAERMRAVEQAWPDGIRHLLAGVQSGLTVHQAVADLAANGPEPLREAFARFELNARMMGTPAALETVKEQLADPASDRIIEVLILAHERGGQIVIQILRDLAGSTVKDLRAREEIQTERLEQTLNARAVFALPWFVLVLVTWASKDAFRDFYAGPLGQLVIGIGALMSVTGMLLVKRLARDDEEERVFGAAGGSAGGPKR
jgi:tight adherence protein B